MTGDTEYFLVECVSDVNSSIKKPLQQTLRIKFTTFDVSPNYLVFGATSGGIYVFNRINLDFLKLVPSKEGAVLKVLICPDEKYILFGTSKGFVILLENCFSEANIKYQLFAEHEGNVITDIIWSCNEIYCGDNKGKVSVISLGSLFSKAIFQTPTATLMHLESGIFQLDTCGKFLLVSTRTKTFLCDTEAEQYRQIGKKLRDGDFGACFFAENPDRFTRNADKEKSRFKFLKEDETFPSITVSQGGARIFCARPGCRLWEANLVGGVVCTYQFKSALQGTVSETICLDNDVNCRLKTRKICLTNLDNFGRLQVVFRSFIITYCKHNLVIFDKQGINILFVYEMRDLNDVKVIRNYLYLWNKKDMRVIAIMDLEFLLLRVLSAKQFALCTELCLKYNESISKLLTANNTLRSLIVLKEKCKNAEDLNALETIFKIIECQSQNDESNTKASPIVKVENGHCDVEQPSCSYSTACSKVRSSSASPVSAIAASDQVHPSHNAKPLELVKDSNYINNILYKQYQVNQLYNNIGTVQLRDLLSGKHNFDDIVILLENFVTYVAENRLQKDNNNVRSWCYMQYLKYMNNKRDCLQTLDRDSLALRTVFEAFKNLKLSKNVCVCGFPLPLKKEDANEEYFSLARDVYYKLCGTDREQLLLRIPILWRLIVSETNDCHAIIIQLSDYALFRERSESFTYDNWNDCTLLLIKVKSGKCLNCDNSINANGVIAWRDFALIMLKRMGGLQTTKILMKYAKFIPNYELGYEFYQSCLFSAVSNENGKSCEFMANVLTSTRLEHKFEDGLRAYLNQKHLGKASSGVFGAIDVDGRDTKCSVCHLFINNAILESSTRLSCGHLFHTLCLESVSCICSICMGVPI